MSESVIECQRIWAGMGAGVHTFTTPPLRASFAPGSSFLALTLFLVAGLFLAVITRCGTTDLLRRVFQGFIVEG